MSREHDMCLLTQALTVHMTIVAGFPGRREFSGSLTVTEEKQEGMILMGTAGGKQCSGQSGVRGKEAFLADGF